MHKSATKCKETIGKWCKNKHGALKIIDTFETYQAPTALVQVTGDTVLVDAIQRLMARMCPGHADWKWEALAHGPNVFLIGLPSDDDVARIDGMQMSVPKFNAQVAISSWRR
jgi:hypothetical protein